jgi:alpha-tubulin suppressor-like RCC1 family protein
MLRKYCVVLTAPWLMACAPSQAEVASDHGADTDDREDDHGTDASASTGADHAESTGSDTDVASTGMEVEDDPSVLTAVSAGGYHTCGILETGQAVCWGLNTNGQLGDGTTTSGAAPRAVSGLDRAIDISAGIDHTCAVRETGEVECWGWNPHGQLGNGTTIESNIPVMVLDDATAVSAGEGHSCAVLGTGEVACWGSNSYGQLGIGSWTHSLTPTTVADLDDATAVSTGLFHSCALRQTGQVVCWGNNEAGQIGDGTTTHRSRPVPVRFLGDAKAVSVGDHYSCALRRTGQVVCWGSNSLGTLGVGGDPPPVQRRTPVEVKGLDDAITVSAGTNHGCAVRESREAVCWGANGMGQLGDGMAPQGASTPVVVPGLDDAKAVSAGLGHTCALRRTGQAACWGYDNGGQLGEGA